MKRLLSGIMITGIITIFACTSHGQRIESSLSLSASGGYSSNTYLMPMVPDWDQSETSSFSALIPSASVLLAGEGRSLNMNSTGHIMHISGDRPYRAAALFSSVFRQRITPKLAFRALGGANFYTTPDEAVHYTRNLQWLRAGMEWFITPFAKFEVNGGSTWRGFDSMETGEPVSIRYDSYGLGLEYWPGFRWQLRADFYSSLDHITDPGKGFYSSVQVARYLRNGLVIRLQTGLEQYSTTFSGSLEAGTGSQASISTFPDPGYTPATSAYGMMAEQLTALAGQSESITFEDRLHRTTLQASRPIGNNITLTGSISGLLWFSDADYDVDPDFQFSAGVRVPISIQRSATGELRSVDWESTQPRDAVLTVRYRGDSRLYITGDFNNWEEPGIPLRKTGRDRYRVKLELTSGMYEYKIIKRDNDQPEWLDLPNQTSTVSDGFGGQNGRVLIDY